MMSVSREKFLREYTRVLADIGSQRHDRRWWATDIASKNRFTSPLPRLFLQPNSRAPVPFWRMGWAWMLHVASVCAEVCRVLFRMYLVRRVLASRIKILLETKGPWYVIKTFVYEHSFAPDRTYRDVMFGALVPRLKQERAKILILANIQGDYRACLARFSSVEEMLLPLEAFVGFGDVLRAVADALLPLQPVKGPIFFFGTEVSRMVNETLRATANGIAFYQVLHYWVMKRLLREVSILTFVLTYENNPWERMMICAIREDAPRTHIIGYQHAVVSQAQANLFVGDHEFLQGMLPDVVLTVGEVTKDMLLRYGSYPEGRIDVGCGLQFSSQTLPMPRRQKSGRCAVLVTLEGVASVVDLIRFVVRGLGGRREFELRWRTHPALPALQLARLLPDLNRAFIPSVSRWASLEEDIGWADVVVYWGSTSALQAVQLGRPVIHCDFGSPLSFDPLADCPQLHWSVSDPHTLPETIRMIMALDDRAFDYACSAARAYAERYIVPVTEQRLRKFF